MSEEMYSMEYPFLSIWVNDAAPNSTGGRWNVGDSTDAVGALLNSTHTQNAGVLPTPF